MIIEASETNKDLCVRESIQSAPAGDIRDLAFIRPAKGSKCHGAGRPLQPQGASGRFDARVLALFVACGLTMVFSAQAATINTTNLLANPGAETGDISGWTAGTGNPGVDHGTFDPGINPHSGTSDFYGHQDALGTLSQTVSLIGKQGITAAEINAGALFANVSFWQQGLDQGTPSDAGQIGMTFLGAGNSILGSVSTLLVDSHALAWQQGTGSFLIPSGTSSIEYTMNFIRNVGTDNDAFIDDNSLTISGQDVHTATPEPSPLGLFLAAGAAMVALWRQLGRRKARSQQVL